MSLLLYAVKETGTGIFYVDFALLPVTMVSDSESQGIMRIPASVAIIKSHLDIFVLWPFSTLQGTKITIVVVLRWPLFGGIAGVPFAQKVHFRLLWLPCFASMSWSVVVLRRELPSLWPRRWRLITFTGCCDLYCTGHRWRRGHNIAIAAVHLNNFTRQSGQILKFSNKMLAKTFCVHDTGPDLGLWDGRHQVALWPVRVVLQTIHRFHKRFSQSLYFF